MSKITDTISETQQYAMAHRPKVGGFPFLAEVLRQAGVHTNQWHLPSCQSIFCLEDAAVVQQGTPLATGLMDIAPFNRDALIAAIRADQEGKSSFPEFLQASWQAGVVRYDVDFIRRHVTYFGVKGESYREDYPAVVVERGR